MGGKEMQGVGDAADRRVQRRGDVVVIQRGAFGERQLALVGGGEDVVAHAALEHRALAATRRANISMRRLSGRP